MDLGEQLERHFAEVSKGAYSGLQDIGINLLTRSEALKRTKEIDFHPVIQFLEGLILEDANTSNYHVLLRRPPLEGSVYYLCHDGDSRIVFESLSSLLSACQKAEAIGEDLTALHEEQSPQMKDQGGLSALIRSLCQCSIEQVDTAIDLIPSMDLRDISLLSELAADPDFYFGEAIANQIELRPAKALAGVAAICASHPHPQVSIPGLRAVQAINRLNSNSE